MLALSENNIYSDCTIDLENTKTMSYIYKSRPTKECIEIYSLNSVFLKNEEQLPVNVLQQFHHPNRWQKT